MTNLQPERARFGKEWRPVVFFLILVTLPTFWVLLNPQTRLMAIVGTSAASAVIGLIGTIAGYLLMWAALATYKRFAGNFGNVTPRQGQPRVRRSQD